MSKIEMLKCKVCIPTMLQLDVTKSDFACLHSFAEVPHFKNNNLTNLWSRMFKEQTYSVSIVKAFFIRGSPLHYTEHSPSK